MVTEEVCHVRTMLSSSNQILLLTATALGFARVPSYGEDDGSHDQITQRNFDDDLLPSCRRGSYLDAASNKCIKCTKGQNYMSADYNRRPSCVKCSTCPALMELDRPCEESYDSVCRCVTGFRITVEGLCTIDRSVKKITLRNRTLAATTQTAAGVSHTEVQVSISTTRSDDALTGTLLNSSVLPVAGETQMMEDTQQLLYLYPAIFGLLIFIILLLITTVGSCILRRCVKHRSTDFGLEDPERNAFIPISGLNETATVSARHNSRAPNQHQRRRTDAIQGTRHLQQSEQQADVSQRPHSNRQRPDEPMYDWVSVYQTGDVEEDDGTTVDQTRGADSADDETSQNTEDSTETSTVVNEEARPVAPTHNVTTREEVQRGIRGLRLTEQQNVFQRGTHFRGQLVDSPPESASIVEEPNDQIYRNEYLPITE